MTDCKEDSQVNCCATGSSEVDADLSDFAVGKKLFQSLISESFPEGLQGSDKACLCHVNALLKRPIPKDSYVDSKQTN